MPHKAVRRRRKVKAKRSRTGDVKRYCGARGCVCGTVTEDQWELELHMALHGYLQSYTIGGRRAGLWPHEEGRQWGANIWVDTTGSLDDLIHHDRDYRAKVMAGAPCTALSILGLYCCQSSSLILKEVKKGRSMNLQDP